MFNALSPPQNQLYVRFLSERAFTFDRGDKKTRAFNSLAYFAQRRTMASVQSAVSAARRRALAA